MTMLMAVWAELKYFFLHLSIAILVVFFPWSIAYRVIRLMTRFAVGASEFDDAAVLNMRHYGFELEPSIARRQIRLHRLIDLADYYKSWVMNRHWLKRYWKRHGDCLPNPAQHPAVLFMTFHYGQGFWALRDFHESGLDMAALYRPPPRPRLGEFCQYAFFWLRLSSIYRLAGAKPIRVGDGKSELPALVRRLVRDHQPVGVMPDIPVPAGQAAIPAQIFGRSIYFAAPLLRLVVKNKIPVVLYTSVLNLQAQHRDVDVQVIYYVESVEELAALMAKQLERVIYQDPTAWHLWPWAHEIFRG